MKILAYLGCVVCLIIITPNLGDAGCISDMNCLSGYKCVKAQFEMNGTCVDLGGGGLTPYKLYDPSVLIDGLEQGLKIGDDIKRRRERQEQHEQQMQNMEEERKLLKEQRKALEEERQARQEERQKREEKKAIYDDKIKIINEEIKVICAKPEYAAIMVKAPCYEKDVTFEQTADDTKITPKQKAVYKKFVTEMDATRKEGIEIVRISGLPNCIKAADYLELMEVERNKYRLDLLNRVITWGQYNQIRKESSARQKSEIKDIK